MMLKCLLAIAMALLFGATVVCGASVHVPRIRQPNYRLTPKDDGYVLRVKLANGARLLEKVEFEETAPSSRLTPDSEAAQTQRRFGKIRQQYPDTNGVLTIHYISDEKGFRMHFNYTTAKTQKEADEEVIEFDTRLDATSLKTLGG